MTPERWQKIEQLYHAALAREECQRAAYLQEVCPGDDTLRQEVESLLAQHNAAGSFLDAPAIEVAAKALAEDLSQSSPMGKQLGSYKILSLLGAGAMGEVYLARDSKLNRDVAIKVLPQAFVGNPERLARFQREARMLASLNHPNIATIYGLEHADAVNYLVMELVSGQTLAERLRVGPLDINEALKISGQIAEGLDAAHEKGVIHRDLKPANVKVTPEGRVKVLDFGLAKAFAVDGRQDLSNARTLTAAGSEDGSILGTPAYMSPEQARGKAVDKRTDIWAFGCVLYELLTGKEAFRGETVSDTIAAILEREPNWQALPAATPAKIRDLLRRSLQKDTQRRLRDFGDARIEIEETLAVTAAVTESNPEPARMGQADLPARHSRMAKILFRRDVPARLARARTGLTDSAEMSERPLRSKAGFAIAAVGLMAVLVAVGWFYRFAARGETIDSVAVLPFVNGSADPNAEYLSDGITESLINSLSQLPNLRVMSRESAFRYKGKQTDAQTVGRQLGVRAVFEGRVTQRGDSLAISAELIDSGDNSHIWGQQYSRKRSDIFALQEEIAKEMTTALRLRLTGADEKLLAKHYTANPEAYQDYLKGRYWWNKRSREGFNKGIDYFQQAISKDPGYALAYAGLADCYDFLAIYNALPQKEAYPRAKQAAQRALEIDETLAEAHTTLGRIRRDFDWDWSGSEREYQRAIQLNPAEANAHQSYGITLSEVGRFEEAITESKRAVELDPLSLPSSRALGQTFYYARQYDQAIEQEQKTLELDPNFIPAHMQLGFAYLSKSMYREGTAEFEKVLAMSRGNVGLAELGYAYAMAGRGTEAEKVLDGLNTRSKQKYVSPVDRAIIYAGLGENNKAFEWLEKGYEDRSLTAWSIKVEPIFDSLRSDPRFQDLLRRMNLQP
jgi:TolB-like protein